MITRLKQRIKESLTFSRFKKVSFNGILFYQDADKDYNGIYRLLCEMGDKAPQQLHGKSYYIIAGGICSLGSEDALLGHVNFEKIPSRSILIDVSTEAINFQLENEFYLENFRKLAIFLKKEKYKSFHFTVIHANSSQDPRFQNALIELGLDGSRVTVSGFDFYFARLHLDMTKANLFQQTDASTDNVRVRESLYHQGKYFLCMNHRPRWHRYAIVLSLIANNLLTKGYVSFAGDKEGRVDAPTVDSQSEVEEILSKYEHGATLLSHLDSLNKMSPLTLDRAPAIIQSELWGKEKTGTIAQPLMLDNRKDSSGNAFNLCYFEIVTETYFTDAHCRYMTEKTLRPIIMKRPFIHVGTPYMLRTLKEYGFKSFSGFIDEAYDEIENPNERLSAILAEINRLCHLSRDQLDKKYAMIQEVLDYNYHHFKNNGQTIINMVVNQLFERC